MAIPDIRPKKYSARHPLTLAIAAMLIALGTAPTSAQAPAGGAVPRMSAPEVSGLRTLRALPFDHILRYDELTALLHDWASARPGLLEVGSIGVTPEGRELWFVTITNRATGPGTEKPALLVDGNMHALEWTGGVAALNFIWTLLRDYGRDERVTRLVDTRCLYVLPRLSPDGVEATLQEGRIIRSVARRGAGEPPAPGLRMRDVDGDGRIVYMRFRDPNGPWKQYPGPSGAGGARFRRELPGRPRSRSGRRPARPGSRSGARGRRVCQSHSEPAKHRRPWHLPLFRRGDPDVWSAGLRQNAYCSCHGG